MIRNPDDPFVSLSLRKPRSGCLEGQGWPWSNLSFESLGMRFDGDRADEPIKRIWYDPRIGNPVIDAGHQRLIDIIIEFQSHSINFPNSPASS
jgi:hypothetical protein